jgi:glycosyltransferase involved in cell wall biosynthesis
MPKIQSISLVYTYYENPEMLERLVGHLASFPKPIRDRIELVVVDDGSPENPATVPGSELGFECRVFRILYDQPWNQSGARNIGVREARHQWALMLDIDMEVPLQTISALLDLEADYRDWFLFSARRVTGGPMPFRRSHNAILMSKRFYWKVGGFDENFDGYYGTAQFFGIAAGKLYSLTHLTELFIDFVESEEVPDANTRTLSRKASLFERTVIWVKRGLIRLGLLRRKLLSHPYVQVR